MFLVQNKCALYWPDNDTTTDHYNIYQGTITVTLKGKPVYIPRIEKPSYIKREFEVVKQQVRVILSAQHAIDFAVTVIMIQPWQS